MITVDYSGKSIEVPTSWEDVTVIQQLNYEKYYRLEPEEHYKVLAAIAGYCNLSMDEVKSGKHSQNVEIGKHLSFINKEPVFKPVIEFEYKGETFSVIETLLREQTQDFISIEGKLSDYKGKENEALPTILAIYAKRKKPDGTFETLKDYDLSEREEFFQNLPLHIALSIRSFFFRDRVSIYNRLPKSSGKSRSGVDEIDKLYQTYNQQTGWWGTLYNLAKEDITKLPQVLETKLEIVLLWIVIGDKKSELQWKVQEINQKEIEKKYKKR